MIYFPKVCRLLETFTAFPQQCYVSKSDLFNIITLVVCLFGEGNGNPLQCSCLENPRDGGTWWAAVYGVAQSQTRLK